MTEISGDSERELLRDMSERASTLYWNSERSVNSIADDLGLSKGRLYELIRPLGSGRLCAVCQTELVFDNRTARDRDEGTCPICDSDEIPLESMRTAAQQYAEMSGATPASPGGPGPSADPTEAALDADSDAPLRPLETKGMLAGFLVGTITGVLLGRYLRR